MLPPLRCPLGFLMTLHSLSMGPSLCLSAGQMPQALCFLGRCWRGGCTEEASPNLRLPPRAWHTQQPPPPPPAVPITPTSGELAAGLSAARSGDLHVSTNIYAHPGPSTPTFLGWPFTPGPETGPLSGWICMRVYFWVGSQLGESERKLLREAVGSSDVSLLTCSIHQIYSVTPISYPEGLPFWSRQSWVHTFPAPRGQN